MQGAAACRLRKETNELCCTIAPALQVPVVSLVGAGDCLTAGFATYLACQGAGGDALALSVGIVAASKVTRFKRR